MNYEELHNIIRTRFQERIADVHSLTTQYDNQNLTKPQNKLWCRFTIKDGDTFQKSIGSPDTNIHRAVGVAFAQLFCPIGKGDKDILAMADNIAEAFRGKSVSGVVFKTPSIKILGRVAADKRTAGSEWQVNVSIPYYADIIG